MIELARSFIPLLAATFFSPLAVGIIRKVKAFFAGRKGPPLLQMYRDLGKLLQKGVVYSRSTTWVFRSAPLIALAVSLIACAWLPFGAQAGIFSMTGGFILIAYLFGFSRFFTILASLDTASAFEGMGANREAFLRL